ncbi:hypothetical protein [Archangium sp.]|nr:hypothetical protein [Archangium sp.]
MGVGFRVRAMPEVRVKGKSAPVRTFTVEVVPGPVTPEATDLTPASA